MYYIYHDRLDHPVYAGWLECLGWRVSSDAGQCRFPDEGRRSLCRVRLFAEARCREGITFGEFEKAIGRLGPRQKRMISFIAAIGPNIGRQQTKIAAEKHKWV